jgi:plastocyanin
MRERKIGDLGAMRLGALLIASVLVLATACTSTSSTTTAPVPGTSSSTGSTSESSSSGGTSSANVSGKTTFDMTAQNFSFTPATLVGTAGQSLQIRVTNTGSVLHNFSITSQSVDIQISPGQEQEFDVTFPSSGSVQFFCKFHKVSNNMVGQLTVG